MNIHLQYIFNTVDHLASLVHVTSSAVRCCLRSPTDPDTNASKGGEQQEARAAKTLRFKGAMASVAMEATSKLIPYRFQKTHHSQVVAWNQGEERTSCLVYWAHRSLDFLGALYISKKKIVSLSLTHDDGRATFLAYYSFGFLWKSWKNSGFPWLENNKKYNLSGFAGIGGYLCALAGYLQAFCGAFLFQKASANHCAFRIHLGCHKAPQCSAD